MSQHIHTKESIQIQEVVRWLVGLTMQQEDGKPVHHIQSCSVVNYYQPRIFNGYMAIVVCNHSMHEHAEEIALEMAESMGEPPMRGESPDGQ